MNRKSFLISGVSCLISSHPGIAAVAENETYEQHFRLAERHKKEGDYAGMETELIAAFQYGTGDEYAWRSLAWAQEQQGKWRESLESAWENVRRNGRSGWSLRQLFSSAVIAGDMTVARQALDEWARLPQNLQNVDRKHYEEDRRKLDALTSAVTYSLDWSIDTSGEARPGVPFRILMPHGKHRGQTFEYKVEGVDKWEKVVAGNREFLEVTRQRDAPFRVIATVRQEPCVLGAKRLATVPAGPCPTELRKYLTPFVNRARYDPDVPEIRRIAADVIGGTSAQTVENILKWLQANMKYELDRPDELAEILRTRRGGCHHYSNLMVTICRACGVPAVVAHGCALPKSGAFTDHMASHGWVEVYLNRLGWVPVEPLNANSLRAFEASVYLFFATSCHTPTDDHFGYWSAQKCPITGRVGDAGPA